jgi:hypothetical protein
MKNKTRDRTKGNKFFYVARDGCETYVSYRHRTIEGAYSEAIRLAKKENTPFFILQTLARIVPAVVISAVEDVRPDSLSEQEDADD